MQSTARERNGHELFPEVEKLLTLWPGWSSGKPWQDSSEELERYLFQSVQVDSGVPMGTEDGGGGGVLAGG
jgi:hypothetical protein